MLVFILVIAVAFVMFPAKLLAGQRQPKEFFAADASRREDVKMAF